MLPPLRLLQDNVRARSTVRAAVRHPIFVLVTAVCWNAITVHADQAKELPTLTYPIEGAAGPDTYIPNASLTTCSLLDPYPATVSLPWNPTVAQAKEFCSQRINCGGIVYSTADINSARGSPSLATASYCLPSSFVAGTISATSGVAFVRHLYSSCDLRISLTSSAPTHYGTLTDIRKACVRPGRGLTPARDRTPRPRGRKYAAPPKPIVELSGHHYEVGKDVFVNIASAQNQSADGSVHTMLTSGGVYYYMPGSSHATRAEAEKPFVRDGWYPLYSTEAGAQAASIRDGGNGQAQEVGPGSALGQPIKWSEVPHAQSLWMPLATQSRTYIGDYIAPFALDGYFPLYSDIVDAQKASTGYTAQSHGPGSNTGHPLSWSNGEKRLFYMPADGPARYYGNYYDTSLADAPLYSHTVALRSTSAAGESAASRSAAQVVAAESMPTNTAAAAATLAAAPVWGR